jgi:hypothetical protein
MNIKQCKNRLLKAMQADFKGAVMVWGAPGLGKTDIVKQIGKELSLPVIMLSLNKMSPVDIMGVPYFDKETGKTVWGVPEIYPDEKRDGKSGILFVDEINTAAPSVQAAAYQLILDRKVGNYKLPDGWFIIAAGNRSKDRGVTFKMPAPLINRFAMHINVEPDIEAWSEWAYRNQIDERVIGFLRWKPDYLHKQPDELEDGKGFPTPRAWENASKLLAIYEGEEAIDAIGDCVGEGVAAEFASWITIYKRLPNTEDILTGKIRKLEINSEDENNASIMYALSTSIISNVIKKPTVDRINNAVNYISQAATSYSYLVVRELIKDYANMIAKAPALSDFVKKHKETLLNVI